MYWAFLKVVNEMEEEEFNCQILCDTGSLVFC